MNPAPPVTNCFTGAPAYGTALRKVDLRMVAQHQPHRLRAPGSGPGHLHGLADQRVGDAPYARHAAVLQHHGVLDLGVDHLTAGPDGGERADVAVDDARALADDRRPSHHRPYDL